MSQGSSIAALQGIPVMNANRKFSPVPVVKRRASGFYIAQSSILTNWRNDLLHFFKQFDL
jgi:hypothetical protein